MMACVRISTGLTIAGRRLPSSSSAHRFVAARPSPSSCRAVEASGSDGDRAVGRASSSRAVAGRGGSRPRTPPRLNKGGRSAAVQDLKHGSRKGLLMGGQSEEQDGAAGSRARGNNGRRPGAGRGDQGGRGRGPTDGPSASGSPPLAEWRREAVRVPTEKVAPTRYSQDPTVDSRAMMGDCMLKAYMLEYMFAHESNNRVTDKGYLTKRLTEALSNRNMQLHAEKVLPPTMFAFLQHLKCSEHEVGTTLEALVYEVRHNEAACRQLAEHLLKWSEEDVLTANWKGMLLQSGLPVEYEVLLQEGPRHKPTWTVQAQVVIESGTVEAVGVNITKRMAEQVAAQNAIAKLKDANLTQSERRRLKKIMQVHIGGPRPVHGSFSDSRLGEDTPQRSANATLLTLEPISYSTYNYSRYVFPEEQGLSPQEWFRNREGNRRKFTAAMNAPYIFPDEIRTVKAWVGPLDSDRGDGDDGPGSALDSQEDQQALPGDVDSKSTMMFGSADELPDEDGEDEDNEDSTAVQEMVVIVRVEDTEGSVNSATGVAMSGRAAMAAAGGNAHALILHMVERLVESRQAEPASAEADGSDDDDEDEDAREDDDTSSSGR